MNFDEEIDAIGLLCPLPVLRLRKRSMPMPAGTVIKLLASDPAAVVDVPHFCNESGHIFLGSQDCDGHTAYFIKKA